MDSAFEAWGHFLTRGARQGDQHAVGLEFRGQGLLDEGFQEGGAGGLGGARILPEVRQALGPSGAGNRQHLPLHMAGTLELVAHAASALAVAGGHIRPVFPHLRGLAGTVQERQDGQSLPVEHP